MWVFTNIGFFSVVEVNGDHKRVVVRARAKDHLEKLRKLGGHKLMPIREDEGTDYSFRVYMEKEQWKELLGKLVDGINYTNFRDSVKDGLYHDSLLEVWSVMLMYQKGRTH